MQTGTAAKSTLQATVCACACVSDFVESFSTGTRAISKQLRMLVWEAEKSNAAQSNSYKCLKQFKIRDTNEYNKHLSGCFKGPCTLTKLSVCTPQPQSILQISTWLTDSFPLWDGQPWIKRTWSLIMHSSVMRPSVATNWDTEPSPGLLSALLGIYGFLYRWFTPHSWGSWKGGGMWSHGQVLPSQGLDLSISRGRPCFHTRATSERSGHYRRRAWAFLSWCQSQCKVMCQPKCARLNILHVWQTQGRKHIHWTISIRAWKWGDSCCFIWNRQLLKLWSKESEVQPALPVSWVSSGYFSVKVLDNVGA